jgi:ferrous iron transport protein B
MSNHCSSFNVKVDIPSGRRRIVLAGNPNVGKSVFFNALTGVFVDVSNYPGTTLEINHGRFGQDVVIDTPGVYGISSFNDEERIARDIILGADIVVNVVDAVNLDRDLFLTQQIIDTGVPIVVALNMIDEAAKHGLEIDQKALSDELGVPVVPTVAVEKKGLKELRDKVFQAASGRKTPLVERLMSEMDQKGISQGDKLLILEGDQIIAERHCLEPGVHREEIYLSRRERINEITGRAVRDVNKGTSFTIKLGRWMLNPITGIPILIATLYLMFKIIGVFVAGDVVGFTEKTIMQGYYEPFMRNLIAGFIPAKSIIYTLLAGEFGLLTMTPTYVLGLLLPLVAGFYLILSILEDSGYLPRIATLVDRLMNTIGLNGRAVIPLILGFGCVTLATIVTRLLGSERERRIAIFLLALAIPCSAQLGVITGMLVGLGISYVVLYILIVFCLMAIVGTLLNQFIPGKSSQLLIDLPAVRLPIMKNVLQKTVIKSWQFIREAGPVFALGAFIICVFQVSGVLEFTQNLAAPITTRWMLLPKETATAFIMGIVRRDFGAAGMYSIALTPMQTLIALVTLTLFVPCIAAMMVLVKERGRKEAPLIWVGSWVIAFLVGGVIAQINNLFSDYGPQAVGAFFVLLLVMTVLITQGRKRIGRRMSPRVKEEIL